MGRCAAAILACASFLLPAAPPARSAPLEELPFPVGKTTILRTEKAVYTVEGRIRIPRGVSISVQKDVHIKAKGGAAVIEVEGTLELQGVASREVIVEGVTLEPCAAFQELNTDSAIFRGGGGIRTAGSATAAGKLFVELCSFQTGATFDVHMDSGSVDVSSCSFQEPVRVRGTKPAEGKPSRTRLFARANVESMGKVGFAGGLEVDGIGDVVIQLSRMAGGLTAVRDWDTVMRFDGNKVNSGRLEFTHSRGGKFAKATVVKCDVYSDKVAASAPAVPGSKDTLLLERCWFKGVVDPKAVAAKVVADGSADPANGARLVLGKINDRPLELAGPVDR